MSVGDVLLYLAAILGVVVFAAGIRGTGMFRKWLKPAYVGMTLCLALATGYLLYLFLAHRFEFSYVAGYSSRDLPLGYLISSLWAGQEGTFLLWAFLASILGLFVIRREGPLTRWVIAYFMITQLFLLILMLVRSPFATTLVAPEDGRGLNPLLQDPWMVIHPPIVFLGYAALAIDAWNFGERSGRAEADLFKELLWHGMVLWGLMVYDSLKAVDYLCTREDVDEARIGTLGMSMGSTMAWWLAALDERIKVCVDICCLTDFHELVRTNGLSGHGIYYFVPGLLRQVTTARINGLIAPRVHLSCAGLYDRLTPPAGLEEIDGALRKEYASHDASANWELFSCPVGHRETFEMRRRIRQELAERL